MCLTQYHWESFFFFRKTERKDVEGRKIILTWFHRPERLSFNSLYCNLAYCMLKRNTVMWYVWCSHGENEELIKENTETGVPWWLILFNAFFYVSWGQIRSWSLLKHHPHTRVSIKVECPAETETRSSAWICSHRAQMELFMLWSPKFTWIY